MIDLVESGESTLSISTLGPFVVGTEMSPAVRRQMVAAGFTTSGSASLWTLYVHTLLFYWQGIGQALMPKMVMSGATSILVHVPRTKDAANLKQRERIDAIGGLT